MGRPGRASSWALLAGPLASGLGVAFWIAVAPLAPALLRLATGREGPVLDVVWMAGLAGALLRAGAGVGWSLPPLWRLLLGGWALVLTLAWPIVVARELDFHWHTLRDDARRQLVGHAHRRPRGGAGASTWRRRSSSALLWFDWLWGRFSREAAAPPRAVHALWLGVTVASVVAIYQGSDRPDVPEHGVLGQRAARRGTLLDANGYGMLAAFAAPVAFWCLRRRLRAGARRVRRERHRVVDVRVAHGAGRGRGRGAGPRGRLRART